MKAQSLSTAPQLHVVPDSLHAAHPLPVSLPVQPAEKSDDFWEIWLQHRDYVYRVCLKCTNSNQIEANELLAQARDKAQSKWVKHAHKVTNPKSWLSSLTKYLYIDLYRAKERKDKVHFGLQQEAMGAIASQGSPESNLLGDELKTYINQLIVELPSRLRTPVILRFHQEKSYKEISFQLSISEATARKRVQQAREKLRKPLRLYLAGLSQSAIATAPDALKDLSLLIEPATPIHNSPPTLQPTRNVSGSLTQTHTEVRSIDDSLGANHRLIG
ncbi:MAG: sigma-70 family RNA polymerase sigma factor [Cyanobacteria bacterium P01_A01_bin.116]